MALQTAVDYGFEKIFIAIKQFVKRWRDLPQWENNINILMLGALKDAQLQEVLIS